MAALDLHAIDVGSGPPVVFLHGWGMAGAVWDRQLTRFAPTHRCVAVDLRGHGRSPKPLDAYAYDEHVEDIARVLDRCGIEAPVLVGWSMGGAIAARAARVIPGVRGVAMIGSPASILARPGYPHGGTEADTTAFVDAIRADRERAFREVAHGTFHADVGEAAREWLFHLLLDVPTWAAVGSFAGVVAADVRADVEALRVPVLAIHGTHDAFVPVGAAHWVAENANDGRLVELAGSGHAPFLEETAAVNDALARFLDDIA